MRKDPAQLPPLDLLASFEAVARLGSITRAAAERFITQSAMSRQVQALEASLGVPLFVRRHRALALTEAGRRLLGSCTSVLAQLRETVALIRAPLSREQLALTTTPGFAALWLIPRLPAFTEGHAGIDVRLDATFERRDLPREGFDLAIRYGPVVSTVGERLFGEAIVPVCSPALAAAGALRRPADLARHTLLQVMPERPGGIPVEWESWLQALGLREVQPRSTLTFSTYHEAVAAALAGQGVALGRRPLIDRLIARGELVVPFGEATATERAYFLIIDERARQRPAVQALAQWLREQAAALAAAPDDQAAALAAAPDEQVAAAPAAAPEDAISPPVPGGDRSRASGPTGSARRSAAPARRRPKAARKDG